MFGSAMFLFNILSCSNILNETVSLPDYFCLCLYKPLSVNIVQICTVGLHSVFCIHSLASGGVRCGLFVIKLADLWINTVQLQHDVGRSFWRFKLCT